MCQSPVADGVPVTDSIASITGFFFACASTNAYAMKSITNVVVIVIAWSSKLIEVLDRCNAALQAIVLIVNIIIIFISS